MKSACVARCRLDRTATTEPRSDSAETTVTRSVRRRFVAAEAIDDERQKEGYESSRVSRPRSSGPGRRSPTRRSWIRRTPSSASTRRRSAGPTFTSSRVTYPRSSPGRSSGTRRSAPSSRSAGSHHDRRRRPRARLVHHLVRPLPLLQGGPLRALHGRRRLDLRPPIDGLQAEYARVPFADTSVYKVPEELTRRAGPLPGRHPPDGVRGRRPERRRRRRATRSRSSAPGPIGLATIMTAKLYTPARIIAIDLADARLEKALEFGADVTINNGTRRRDRDGDGADRRPRRRRRRSRRSACPRRSSSAPRSSGPAGASRTSACTAIPATLHLETLWIRTSRSRPVSSTRHDAAAAEAHRRAAGSTRRRSRRTGSRSPTRRPRTTSSRPPRRRTRSRSCSRPSPCGRCPSTPRFGKTEPAGVA